MRLGEAALMTRDVRRLAAFYRFLLRLEGEADDPVHQTLLSRETQLTVCRDEACQSGQSVCLAFTVEDIEAEHRRLLAHGVPVEQPPRTQPWGTRNLICLDPDGNRVNLRQFARPTDEGPIRRLTSADRETYLAMARAFYQSDAVLHPVPDSHLEATFAEMLRSDQYAEGFLLLSAGLPAGYALLSKTFSQEAGGRVVWLEELFVLPEYRGRGIGRAFFAYLHEHIPAARYRLEAEPENAGALRLYRSLGYRELPYSQLFKED